MGPDSMTVSYTLINMDTGEPVDFTHLMSEDNLVYRENPEISKVIWNPPATIVYWKDRSKTVVVDEDILKVGHSEDPNKLTYTYLTSKGNKKVKTVNFKRWKEDGLINAMLKKYRSHYVDDLREWVK